MITGNSADGPPFSQIGLKDYRESLKS